jgi:hypothetical protein
MSASHPDELVASEHSTGELAARSDVIVGPSGAVRALRHPGVAAWPVEAATAERIQRITRRDDGLARVLIGGTDREKQAAGRLVEELRDADVRTRPFRIDDGRPL